MKKFILFILMVFVSCAVFISCSDNVDDREKPAILTSFKDNDTLYISARDTNVFTIELQDNEALSTLKIHLVCNAGIDTLSRDSTSAALQKSIYMWGLFNAKSAIVTDTFSIQTTTTYKSQRYPVSAGDTSIYKLIVGCIDRAGNYDSVVYKVNLVIP
ncbi:hypothetical protein [Viscerimonas tarda]